MKGLNVKRIAALAVGAAILGATLAFAAQGVTFGNTQIISADGTPQVKVVVGSGAAASDGVAAANIAAVIGNLAFSSQTITATVDQASIANLGCTVTSGGAGTCAVSNSQVTLDVTVPGTISGVYQFNTYINDYIDKKLENRKSNTGDDQYTSTIEESPFTYTGTQRIAIKKIDSTEFPALQSPSVTDTYANEQYTEAQTLWVWGTAKYDTGQKQLSLEQPAGAYQIEFTQDQAGIPTGTCDATSAANLDIPYQNNTNNAGNYNLCGDTDQTARHRVQLGFLGDTYIISAMNPPSCTGLNSATSECSGGSISLAKESAYGIVHVGENLTAGAYSIKLEDIQAPLGNAQEAAASIAIYDSTGTMLKEDKVEPSSGSSYSWTAPDGTKVRIRVYKTNPGYYAYAKWAEMAIYSQEFTLTDGQEINSDNPQWDVSLVWRNENPTYTFKGADALRKIILYNPYAETASGSYYFYSGDSFNFIQTPVAWNVQYGGLTLGSGDYDNLQLSMHGPTESVTVQTNFEASCNAVQTTYSGGNFIEFRSTVPGAFQLSGTQEVDDVQDFYLVVNSGGNALSNTNGPGPATLPEGTLIFKKPSQSCYYKTTGTMAYLAGDATLDDERMTYVTDAGHSTTPAFAGPAVILGESASSTSGVPERDYWEIPLYLANDGITTQFLPTSASTSEIYYSGVTDAQNPVGNDVAAEVGYYTERGSYLTGVSSDSVSIARARKLGEMEFFVKSPGTNTSSATTVGPLGVNESYNIGNGVTVKVDTITQTVGTCTATGAVPTVTGANALTATPSQSQAYVRKHVDQVLPLVMLDTDSAGQSATLIVVGGPLVNTVAQSTMSGTQLSLTQAGQTIVQAVGTNRILVAGYTAGDTTSAANQFIQDLVSGSQ